MKRALAPVVLLFALLSVVLAPPVPAQGDGSLEAFGLLISGQSLPSFTLIGAGARPAGMGGAFTALADDAAATSFNPAGLALLLKPEVSVVLDGQRRGDAYLPFTNVEAGVLDVYSGAESSFSTQDLNFAAFTVPFKVASRNLCLQLSYHRQIDFAFESERRFEESLAAGGDPFARYLQQVDQSGDLHTFSLAAAYQLTQRLSLGAGLSRWDGDWTFSTFNTETELPEDVVDHLLYVQSNELTGWSWSLGLLLRYRYLNVGATWRLGFAGDYTFSSLLDTNVPTVLTSQPAVTRTLHWPTSSTIGIAVKPTATWHVTVDYTRFSWSEMEIRGVGQNGSSLNFFDLRPSAQTVTPDVEQWRVGTEYTLFVRDRPLFLRGGYFREPEPRGTSIDGKIDFTGYSAGLGFVLGPLRLDVAYQRRTGRAAVQQLIDPSIVATGSVTGQAIGDIDTTDERFFVALLYQFSSSDKLKDVFRFLFVGPRKKAVPPPGGGA